MQPSFGYYSVKINKEDHIFIHTILAKSDYDAALKIRKQTGYMPLTEDDVSFLYVENMRSDTYLPWLYKNNLYCNES